MPSESELGRRALDIVTEAQLGMFMTCDERGYPHGRWMHMLPIHGLQELYSLTADGTRKVRHIQSRPEVCWLVTLNQQDIVLLRGRAEVHRSFSETQEVWDRLAAAAQRYAVGPMSDEDHTDLVTVRTKVEYAELISPTLGLHVACEVRLV